MSIPRTLHLSVGQIKKSVIEVPSLEKFQVTWGVVHLKTRNVSFFTHINVNNRVTVCVSTQVLPGSGLETWDLLFLESLLPSRD